MLSNEDKEWVATKLNQSNTEKDEKIRDWFKVASMVHHKLLLKKESIPEEKRAKMEERLEKAMSKLSEEQKEKLDKIVEKVKAKKEANPEEEKIRRFIGLWRKVNNGKADEKQTERFESLEKKLDESQKEKAEAKINQIKQRIEARKANPKQHDEGKRVHRFVCLWRKVTNGKADEKQKEKYETIEKKLNEAQREKVEALIKAIKAKREEKMKSAPQGDRLPLVLREFKEKYEALEQSEKDEMNEKLGGSLHKITAIVAKRQAFFDMTPEERKKHRAEKKSACMKERTENQMKRAMI